MCLRLNVETLPTCPSFALDVLDDGCALLESALSDWIGGNTALMNAVPIFPLKYKENVLESVINFNGESKREECKLTHLWL